MKSRTWLTLLACSFTLLSAAQQKKYTISGYVTEAGSKELLIGATIYASSIKNGTATNNYGFYSITLPADSTEIIVNLVGYERQYFKAFVNKDITMNFSLSQANTQLKEAVVTSDKIERISEDPQMSLVQIPVEQIKEIPALFGEKDVLKVIQLLPGVQKGSEGNSGLYVRGGGPDQNLIILDDAPVYNAFHLFGFFSLFNGDALKSVELTKGGFPARYGGRLSSVLDMSMKDGNKEKIKGEAGIGLISSRLTLEGPLVKNKSSFLVSARRTYIDVLIMPFMQKDMKAGYYFYDVNAKLNYDFGQKDKVYLSGYFGRDKFYGNQQYDDDQTDKFGLYWGNATATARWNHLYTNKLFSNTSFIVSNYRFNIFEDSKNDNQAFYLRLYSGIRDISLKQDFDYALHPNHMLKAGVFIQQHRFTPSGFTLKDSQYPDDNKRTKQQLDALETGVYGEDQIRVNSRIKLNTGLRFSSFSVTNKTYTGIEPRFSGNYMIREDLSFKASYALMNQYIHLLTGTGIGLPTDLWVPATARIAPQRAHQVATGFAKDISNKNLTLSVEGYYKKSSNVIAYKEGASFLIIDDPESNEQINWEDNVTSGQGWSYGTEFFLQRKKGKLTGWVGYTLSWTQLQFDELNFGKKYYARYDRRHDISVVGIYHLSEQFTLSATWIYGTGNAVTLPKAGYNAPLNNTQGALGNNYYNVSDYGAKNSFRMAPYHRMDVSFQFHKELKHSERIFELSFYNVYNRANPYFYYLGYTGGRRTLKQVSLFPILPSISWTYKF